MEISFILIIDDPGNKALLYCEAQSSDKSDRQYGWALLINVS